MQFLDSKFAKFTAFLGAIASIACCYTVIPIELESLRLLTAVSLVALIPALCFAVSKLRARNVRSSNESFSYRVSLEISGRKEKKCNPTQFSSKKDKDIFVDQKHVSSEQQTNIEFLHFDDP